MKKKTKTIKSEAFHIFLEILLIFASVWIFRSAWLLMDSIPLFNTTSALIVMLVTAVIVTLVCIQLLFKHERFHKH